MEVCHQHDNLHPHSHRHDTGLDQLHVIYKLWLCNKTLKYYLSPLKNEVTFQLLFYFYKRLNCGFVVFNITIIFAIVNKANISIVSRL